MTGRYQICIAGLLLMASQTMATSGFVDVDGARFDLIHKLEQAELPLRGAGTLHYGLFFKAYVAALYAPPVPSTELLDPATARALEIVYFVDIPRERMTAFAERRLQQQLDASRWEMLGPRLRHWHGHFRDVEPGDRYSLAYANGTLSLSLNDRLLVSVEDAALARAYFGLWLGDSPLDEDLRNELIEDKTLEKGPSSG